MTQNLTSDMNQHQSQMSDFLNNVDAMVGLHQRKVSNSVSNRSFGDKGSNSFVEILVP